MNCKALSSGERKIIINVVNYFETENFSLKSNALVEMTTEATRASATSERIVGEEDVNKSPDKSRPKRKKHSTEWTSLTLL